jgi:hypothetical protein
MPDCRCTRVCGPETLQLLLHHAACAGTTTMYSEPCNCKWGFRRMPLAQQQCAI